MQDHIKCDACKGSKSVIALGNISKKCSPCQGVGFVKIPDDQNPALKQFKYEPDIVINSTPKKNYKLKKKRS